MSNERIKQLFRAIYDYNYDEFKRLLGPGPTFEDINNQDYNDSKDTLLLAVCAEGFPQFVKLLLSYSNIDVNVQDSIGSTPLHWACCYEEIEIVPLFLARDDTNFLLTDIHGDTPFSFACREGYFVVALLLLDYYPAASLNNRNKDGKTPFDYACQYGNTQMIEAIWKKTFQMDH